MTKSFREILAEKDDEFTYHVRSTANIHDPERFERIRYSFLPYQVKSIEAAAYSPLSKDNKWFPAEPNSATYSVKVITGMPIQKASFIQSLAPDVHIHHAHLVIDGEDDIETDLVNEPEAIDKPFSQSLVGQHRIGEFIRELQADRKERENKTVTREVYETFFTTHRSIETLLKKPVRNGYYMVERFGQDGKQYLSAEGPFTARPDGNGYRDYVRAHNPRMVSESMSGGLYGVQVLIDSMMDDVEVGEKVFEVNVHDSESGRRYTCNVRASTPDEARKMAVRSVAETHRLDPETLMPMAPKPARQVAENEQTHYIARVSNRGGKAIYHSQPHPSREHAAKEAFDANPKCRECSTSRATMIDGQMTDRGGFDVQGHKRHHMI